MSRKNSLAMKKQRRAERTAHKQELELLDFYAASRRWVHNDLGTYKVLPYPQDPQELEALIADQFPAPTEPDTSTQAPNQADELDTSTS